MNAYVLYCMYTTYIRLNNMLVYCRILNAMLISYVIYPNVYLFIYFMFPSRKKCPQYIY